MGISFVNGQMLNSNLTRQSNLAFNTNTLYINYTGNAVGIGTATPGATLEVVGNVLIGNVLISNIGTVSAAGNITGGNILTAGIFSSTGNLYSGNLLLNGYSISTTNANLVTFTGNTGITVPYGNSAQRPSPAPTGALRLNTALNQLETWNGTTWIAGGGSSGNVTIVDQQITPDGSSATYTLTQSATQASILVSINGVSQLPTGSYSVSGNSITFNEIPTRSDIIDIRFLAAAVPPGTLYNTSGNAAVYATDTSGIIFEVNSANVVTITTGAVVDMSASQSLKLPSFTVAQAANIAGPTTGQLIYVSNGNSGNACLAVYSNGAWKQISLGANITA